MNIATPGAAPSLQKLDITPRSQPIESSPLARETRSSPLRTSTARPSPSTPDETISVARKPAQPARNVSGMTFFEYLKAAQNKPAPLLSSPFRNDRATKDSGGESISEPRRRVTYGFEASPLGQASARKSAAAVAVDLSAGRNRKRVSKSQDSTPTKTKRYKNSSLQMTDAPLRSIDEDLTPRNRSTGMSQSIEKSSAKDLRKDAKEIQRRKAAHKDEPDVRYAWPASQPPPKLFAPPRVLRALGEAGISARQKYKVDESFDPNLNPWTHRFERKINKTDGSTLSGNRHDPGKEIDERLVALPKTPKKSGIVRSAPGTIRAGQHDASTHLSSARRDYDSLDDLDLDPLFVDDEYVYGKDRWPERAPTPAGPPEDWREEMLSENVEKAKRDPYEGLS